MSATPQIFTFDVNAFRAQFPAFASTTKFPDTVLQQYWDWAICYISDVNYGFLHGAPRLLSLNLMTAHLTAQSVAIAGGQTPGFVSSATIDKVTVTRQAPPIPNQWQWWLDSTPYGAQLLALLQVSTAGGFRIGDLPERFAIRQVYGIFPGQGFLPYGN